MVCDLTMMAIQREQTHRQNQPWWCCWYSLWISQNTRNFLIKTNFIHIYSISIWMFSVTLYTASIGMWVGLLELRGWSWWHTTMHFQSQWFHETWQNKNQLCHYITAPRKKKRNTQWTLYRILFYACCCWYRLVVRNFIWMRSTFSPLAVLVFIQSV